MGSILNWNILEHLSDLNILSASTNIEHHVGLQ